MAVRSEFAKVGNSAQDRAIEAMPSTVVISRGDHHIKFMMCGFSAPALCIFCHSRGESMTSMLMTAVSVGSSISIGATLKFSARRAEPPMRMESGKFRKIRRTRVSPAECPDTRPASSTWAFSHLIASFMVIPLSFLQPGRVAAGDCFALILP